MLVIFIFKWVRNNLFAHNYCHCFYTVKWFQLLRSNVIELARLVFYPRSSPMVWETWVQSQVASYRRLRKWNLIPRCLSLSHIRYVSRYVEQCRERSSALHLGVVAIEKGAFWSPSTKVANFSYLTYCDLTQKILFNINHLFTPSEFVANAAV